MSNPNIANVKYDQNEGQIICKKHYTAPIVGHFEWSFHLICYKTFIASMVIMVTISRILDSICSRIGYRLAQ